MRILFTYKERFSTFMNDDFTILASFTDEDIDTYKFRGIKKPWHLIRFFLQFFYLTLFRYDLYFCYFADYHSVLPVFFAKIRRKKSVVVSAGYDCFSNPRYGVFSSWWRGWCARYVFRNATWVLTNADHLKDSLVKNGVLVDDRFRTVHFGMNCNPAGLNVRKKGYVLTVGICENDYNFFRKGYDRLVEIATITPDTIFYVVGLRHIPDVFVDDFARLKNISIVKEASRSKIISMMCECKCYLHLARQEGMPTVVMEAMSCGCNVIAYRIPGIEELAPERMYPENYESVISSDIRSLVIPYNIRNFNRIKEHFSVSKRSKMMEEIILKDNLNDSKR